MEKRDASWPEWLQKIPYYGALALLVYMPFHVFLSQSLSVATGGLDAWKVAKDIVTGVLAVATIVLVWCKRQRAPVFTWLVGLGLAYAGLHLLLWAGHPHIYRPSAEIGILYNNRVIAYGLIGCGAALLARGRINVRFVMKLIVGVSAVVSVLGVVQYFLPGDILRHFGYSIARGVRPDFFIDNNPKYPRVFATLRDPNSFGAYLILPITILLTELLNTADRGRRTMCSALLLLEAAALLLTFSRSAWLAALLATALTLWWCYHEVATRSIKRWWPILVIGVLLLGAGIFATRHDTFVKSYIIHSTGKPQAQYDSDGFHWYFVKRGALGIWHDPLGHGPGTAGLASIQNPRGGILTENYYVQIGYELGVLGLLLFLAINVLLYYHIRQRHDQLGYILLATFWAYVVTNMLLHMWSNEPVAAQWWILAGLAVGVPISEQSSD